MFVYLEDISISSSHVDYAIQKIFSEAINAHAYNDNRWQNSKIELKNGQCFSVMMSDMVLCRLWDFCFVWFEFDCSNRRSGRRSPVCFY